MPTATKPTKLPPTPESTSAQEDDDLAVSAALLAEELLSESLAGATQKESNESAKLARMLDDQPGKEFTIALADQVMRFSLASRGARRFRSLLENPGPPEFLSALDRILLGLAGVASRFLPSVVMPQITNRVRLESSDVILSGEPKELSRFLRKRESSGTRININQLGEAVLGEREARHRLDAVLGRIADPEITNVSVKLSAIFSQINLVAYDATLEQIKLRLRELYRAAIANPTAEGRAKFITLDMEEYRDLHVTVDAFQSVLEETEFSQLEAGIVLQAYLPDSFAVQKSLTQWAKSRVQHGGSGIRVRLVKGANLAMEKVEAIIHGWEQAPYCTKCDVDANFKRMLHFACKPDNAEAVQIGVASHNLFDIAYAFRLREHYKVTDRIEFEMLEGMANAQARIVQQRAGGLLIYAPVVQRADFQSAIAYLVRRLEENTTPGNFLRDLFGLSNNSAAWQNQRDRFLEACRRADSKDLSRSSQRTQNRQTESPAPAPPGMIFCNAADTDFTQHANRQWADDIIKHWRSCKISPVTFMAGGHENQVAFPGEGRDPSRAGVVAYRYAIGNEKDVDNALRAAVEAQPAWEAVGIEGRAHILRKAAAVIAQRRGESIGCMVMDGAKAIMEADAEISEAVDFANYYAESLHDPDLHDGAHASALGVVLVAPPWNFPYAIPAGGCLAALAAGNAVILKPPLETVLTARKVAEHLWEAGVPRDVLQFLTVPDDAVGQKLVTDDRVDSVILTGGYETARLFQSWKPQLRLSAETSGKNSLIITQAADLDLAIKDLVRGAFGHSGQKCSATSLALVEVPVYDDPAFMRQLKDAVESLSVGSAWDPSSIVTPLIREPGAELQRALTTLDPGESWLLAPRMIDDNPMLWSPGIRLNVRQGGWFHRTECFGPVLGIMRVDDLDDAIAIQNDNAFGLTGGIHSLDEQETKQWQAKVEVGNAYINRSTTGAIVQRQPFGGWKQSCIGRGAKAGGPNYVASFLNWSDDGLPSKQTALPTKLENAVNQLSLTLCPSDQRVLKRSAENYYYWWFTYFSKEQDPSILGCERNAFRYRAKDQVLLFSSSPLASAQITIASRICGVPCLVTSSDTITGQLKGEGRTFVRALEPLDDVLLEAANNAHVPIHSGPVLANGRIELLHFFSEQSVSETRHRYGNLMAN